MFYKKKLFPNFRHTCGESNGESFASYEQFVAKKNDENRFETSEKDVKMTPDDSPYDSPFFIIVKYDTRPF